MFQRVGLELPLPIKGSFDLVRRNRPFLYDSMRDHHRFGSVKKVKHPILHSLEADPQFIDSITKEVGFRSSQFVAHLPQPL